ncbi:MAG TPA: aminomethyl-transferring glycine dehydrogenase [Bacteroidota bacterium]|nr:aminomethyl-transferring glycine dehydrogenase [Bacteroidota bacterium]
MKTEQNELPFQQRHIGPHDADLRAMLAAVGSDSMETFIKRVIPEQIRTSEPYRLAPPLSERDALAELRSLADQNRVARSLIGMGYSDTITPAVIQRNILENPGWYTQYTPYQAEIAQGRLEALLNFQTMVIDLTGFPIANASLLDEGTAAAEAMGMFFGSHSRPENGVFFVSADCHPQTIAVVSTRARHLGIRIRVGDHNTFQFDNKVFGALLQYPATDGLVCDYRDFCTRAHASGARVVVAADLLSLALLVPPAEFGADAAVGNSQRFGVPLGFGGPHAAFLATTEAFKRIMPGRIIGVSVDSRGEPALRMALQTREQHIRREKATSNICTAQVLLAIMAGFYAVYHGPDGIRRIAERIHAHTALLAAGIRKLGLKIRHELFFDTIRIDLDKSVSDAAVAAFAAKNINVRVFSDSSIGISLDELTTGDEVDSLLAVLAGGRSTPRTPADAAAGRIPASLARTSPYLTHPVFSSHRSETELLRYIHTLQEKDLSLTFSMIPLGSCTMKLNATSELLPVTWREFAQMHPFAPADQTAGYRTMISQLEEMLKDLTGFSAISFQPNSGAQGEYTGLLVIRAYHEKQGQNHRNICLIPSSAHGTNPASAVMAGMEVVVVRSLQDGSIDVADLKEKAAAHRDRLAALMVTYPSTHGVFEETIREICRVIHEHGGLVYMDGANLNAQVGLCRPAEIGADVCHLNLHKTFCIPHGGGGPGMGPIGVVERLKPFLPGHPVVSSGAGQDAIGPVASAPWGSPSILPISWMYIRMMGTAGLTEATRMAILNANYMAARLEPFFPIVYKGANGRVAHEFIIDLRPVKESAGIEVEDVAKRLMDYGFHAPTTSFPVPGTLMIEPTESESRAELDRYCEALISIRREIEEIEQGKYPKDNNVLKNAPHTADMIAAGEWKYPYSREKAVYPAPWVRSRKFWPPVGRINSAYGDKNLVCSCPPVTAYEDETVRQG